MDERERRLAQNEALFREVNERIGSLAQTHHDAEHVYEFLCECANSDCTFRLEVSSADYERVRANPRRFIVRPGHHVPEVEQVVEQHDTFAVVEKGDDAGEYVERINPRDRDVSR